MKILSHPKGFFFLLRNTEVVLRPGPDGPSDNKIGETPHPLSHIVNVKILP